ncbi:MAG: Gfo/Idh/MocA family protein, partial [Bacteroidota bacterium]
MKKEVLKAGLIGCGDYLRREIDSIYNSKYFEVKYTYDPDQQKRRKMADRLVAASVDSTEVIFGDEEISIVMIYTPPSSRRELFTMAVDRRKHIITSAPFGTSLDEGRELKQIINDRVNCAVFYDRTGDASAEKIREILKSGEIGKLALYKEDLL